MDTAAGLAEAQPDVSPVVHGDACHPYRGLAVRKRILLKNRGKFVGIADLVPAGARRRQTRPYRVIHDQGFMG